MTKLKYWQTERGKKIARESSKRYRKSAKGAAKKRAHQKRYSQTEKGRAVARKAVRKFYQIPEPLYPAPKVCEICKRPPDGRGRNRRELHIDHDHETGKFRGWLCPSCNMGLGLFGDDKSRLLGAIQYLEDRA